MNSAPIKSSRITFNKYADRYDTYRPDYPEELFDTIIGETGISGTSNLLEIGPGTGQATRALAKRKYSITAIELGDELAKVVRSNLLKYPKVQIVHGSFEATPFSESQFDLIYAATAFHWIKDEYKFTKTASLLKPKGHLAIIHTEYIDGDDGADFLLKSEHIYNEYLPSEEVTPRSIFTSRHIDDLRAPQIDDTLFKQSSFNIFSQTLSYSAEQYAGLLSTYSPVIALESKRRTIFLDKIKKLIENEFNGILRRRLAFILTIAQKKLS